MWSSQALCIVAMLCAAGSALPFDEFGRDLDDSQESSGLPRDFATADKVAPVSFFHLISPSARIYSDDGFRASRRSGSMNQKPGIPTKNSDPNNREGIGKMACFFKICTFKTEML